MVILGPTSSVGWEAGAGLGDCRATTYPPVLSDTTKANRLPTAPSLWGAPGPHPCLILPLPAGRDSKPQPSTEGARFSVPFLPLFELVLVQWKCVGLGVKSIPYFGSKPDCLYNLGQVVDLV